MSGVDEAAMTPKLIEITVYTILTKVAYATKDWVRFEGSQERLYITGHDFKIGDPAVIRISHA